MIKLFVSTIPLLLICCSSRQNLENRDRLRIECEDFIKTSFDDLIRQPYRFHNKKIRVEGYFHYVFEDVAIYESRNSDNKMSAVWVDFDKKLNLDDDKFEKLAEEKIDVVGVFDADHRGHLNQYIGELNILCIAETNKPH